MKSYFKFELKRLILSRSTLVAILIAIITMMFPYVSESRYPWPNEDGFLFFIRIRNQVGSYLPLLSPIIAMIPTSTTYLVERECGICNYLFIKLKRNKYMRVKYFTNILVGGLVLVIPQILVLIILIITKGINNNVLYEITGPFSTIFYKSKGLYTIILLIGSFIFGAIISTLSLGISALFQNKYLAIIIPYVYIILSGSIFYMIGINNYINLDVISLFCIYSRGGFTTISYVANSCMIFLIGSILFFYNGEKKDEI